MPMRKAKERLGQPHIKPGLQAQLGVRKYKFDGDIFFEGSEAVTNTDGRTEFDAMWEFSYGTTNYRGIRGDKPERTIRYNAKSKEEAQKIKEKLDKAGFKQE